eukprot:2487471-Amphidinium_carterae.1
MTKLERKVSLKNTWTPSGFTMRNNHCGSNVDSEDEQCGRDCQKVKEKANARERGKEKAFQVVLSLLPISPKA